MILLADLKALGKQAIRGDFKKDALNPAEIYRASEIQEGENPFQESMMPARGSLRFFSPRISIPKTVAEAEEEFASWLDRYFEQGGEWRLGEAK